MKTLHSALAVALMVATGVTWAAPHEPQDSKTAQATAQPDPMDHSKMDMANHGKKDHGAMSADHAKMAEAEFAKLDTNKDGMIAKSEIPAKDSLMAHFGMLDTDKDGSLSKAEFAKHHSL